ncbi:TolC family protein [Rhodopirellula europaea]|uniref:Outer membrane efflux protein n=1 Tax=Rhodopirellula europaea 6C TaxID=1263867 RepID=M2AUG1_9BACT|nr:TolC family protein [Rhodopirellula europaea]EMB16352.1 Outer membrane efflux protein [Rhodopirellula europaea 6C]
MYIRKSTVFSRNRKRHLLALSLVTLSVGGCASGPVRPNGSRHAAVSRPAVSEESLSDELPQPAPDASNESNFRTVGYGQPPQRGEVVLAAQLDLAAPMRLGDEEEDEPKTLGEMLEIEEEDGEQDADDEETADNDSQLSTPNSQLSTGQPVDYFISQALAAHPSIQAARQRVQAELERIPQVTALPDPQFNNTFWPLHDNALQTAGGRIANQMSLQQGVPFPDKLRTKGAIVSREAQIAQAEVERIERKITESVRLSYYEVWYATRAIAIIEESRDLVDDLAKVAEARYRSGGTQQDVLRAQLEIDRLDDQIIQLTKQLEMSQADLAALLQQPVSLLPQATEELGIADAPMQLDALISQAEQCNPSLRGLAAEIQRDRQKQRLACLQQYPDFMVGLNWGIVSDNHDVISPVANGNDNLSITFGTTLPIWREKINAGVREASRRTSSTQQRLEAERDEIYGRLRRLLAQADSLVEQTDIYEDRIIPRTEDTLKLAIADYRGERTDFFTLIETYRELLMFETQLARINASLAGAIAQIDRTVGCPY